MRNTRRGWMIFNEADKGGGTGGGGGEPNPTEENEPEPVGNTLEEKLTSAKTIISQLFARAKSIVGLTKERDDAKAESARLQGQFDAATGEATSAKNDLIRVKGELETARTEVTGLTTERDTARGNVTRLEKLCGVKGIDPNQAVAAAIEPVTEGSDAQREEILGRLEKATNALDRNAIANELREFDQKRKKR